MGDFWASRGGEDCVHAALRFDEVAASGPPARPLEFPTPTVYRCKRIDVRARDHRSGTVHFLKNLIIRMQPGRPADTAYLVKKKLAKSVYGSVRVCVVLKRSLPDGVQARESRQDSMSISDDSSGDFVEWESTDQQVVIKASSWARIHALRGRHLEDPIKEIAAMQHLGNYCDNVLGALEVLQDDDFLYTVMNHLAGGDLHGRLLGESHARESHAKSVSHDSKPGFDEQHARVWFRQLLSGLFHLQKKGVCHRDISLENILLDNHDKVVIIDPGMSLRVPYTDPCNYGCVTDVSAGTCRRLIKNQGQGGKLMYAAPEIIEREDAFDGFAVDLWAAGVVLFVMLVGLAPFKWAHPSDKRYAKISRGGLRELMKSLEIPVSEEACSLLQGMFWKDPRRRLSLAEVMDHPWVTGKIVASATASAPPAVPHRSTFNDVRHKRIVSAPPTSSTSKGQPDVHHNRVASTSSTSSSSTSKGQPTSKTQPASSCENQRARVRPPGFGAARMVESHISNFVHPFFHGPQQI